MRGLVAGPLLLGACVALLVAAPAWADEPSIKEQAWGEGLARAIGKPGEQVSKSVGKRGVRLRITLPGLLATRYRFRSQEKARAFGEELELPAGEAGIVEVRGEQVVVLVGEELQGARRGPILYAAWDVLEANEKADLFRTQKAGDADTGIPGGETDVVVIGIDTRTQESMDPYGFGNEHELYLNHHIDLVRALARVKVRGLAFCLPVALEGGSTAEATEALVRVAAESGIPVIFPLLVAPNTGDEAIDAQISSGQTVIHDLPPELRIELKTIPLGVPHDPERVGLGTLYVGEELVVPRNPAGMSFDEWQNAVHPGDPFIPIEVEGKPPLEVELLKRVGALPGNLLVQLKLVRRITIKAGFIEMERHTAMQTLYGISFRERPPKDIPMVSYVDAIDGKVDAKLRGKLALVGCADGRAEGAFKREIVLHASAMQHILEAVRKR